MAHFGYAIVDTGLAKHGDTILKAIADDCVLFAAAAWKVKARDAFIGWSAQQRQQRLSLIINNSRFLILPHVRVPHLASHILGTILRRLRSDWQHKYEDCAHDRANKPFDMPRVGGRLPKGACSIHNFLSVPSTRTAFT
jgi:hypothetical protein